MKSSCIPNPENEPLLVIRQWQIEATGDPCSAALLSFFTYWHDIKLAMQPKAREANTVAVGHGEEGTQDAGLFQFHTSEGLSAGIMGIYNRDRIRSGIKKLVELGFISVHRNPNPRYKFDNTKHFLFYPEKVREWLSQRTPAKNRTRTAESRNPSAESRRTIPETTNKTTSEIPKKVKGASGDALRAFSEFQPRFPYPLDEDEMYNRLELEGIEPNPDYDGNFFETMQRKGWKIRGKPVFDWIATYQARLEVTSPGS